MWGPNSRRQINATENKQELRHLGGFTARLLMPIAVNCLIMTRGGIRNGAFMAARSRVRSAPKPPTKHLNPSRVKNSFAASLPPLESFYISIHEEEDVEEEKERTESSQIPPKRSREQEPRGASASTPSRTRGETPTPPMFPRPKCSATPSREPAPVVLSLPLIRPRG